MEEITTELTGLTGLEALTENITESLTESVAELTETITETITDATEKITTALNNGGAAGNSINTGGGMGSYWMIIYYIVVVALLIAGMFLLRKYLLKKTGGAKNGAYMKVIDRLVIAQDRQIILVETVKNILMVGITAHKMETLAEFSKEEFEAANEHTGEDGGGNANGSFLSLLKGKFNFKDGGKNEK